jgi:hypothetical protein
MPKAAESGTDMNHPPKAAPMGRGAESADKRLDLVNRLALSEIESAMELFSKLNLRRCHEAC